MKYLIGALVVIALLFLVWWFVSKGKKRQLEEQRSEAARLRAGAEEHDTTIRGQEAFVQQADERASVARQEAEDRARQAEESAREAQRVEDEARRHQEELDRARLARDAQLRRADEIDPDVEVAEGDPRPLPEDLDDDVRPLDSTRDHTPDPLTETDREQDRGSWGTGAAATGAGAAAIGSAYAATRGDVSDDEAARLASGVDYSDSRESRESAPVEHREDAEYTPAHAADSTRGHDGAPTGLTGATEGTEAMQATDAVSTDGTPDDARPTVGSDRVDLEERQGHDMSEHEDTTRSEASDAAEDRADATGSPDATPSGEADMAMVSDIEDYASTEPLPMEEQTPVTHDDSRGDLRDESATSDADFSSDAEPSTTRDESTATEPISEPVTEPTTEDTWESDSPASDGDSTTSSDRADESTSVEDEGVRTEGGDSSHWPDGTDRVNTLDNDSVAEQPQDADTEFGATEGEASRRVSGVDEIRDGGFGVGSAAPFEDRSQPADHPVQAYHDTRTFRVPGAPGYDSAEPDVWFYDEEAARRAGFNPSEG